MTIINLLILSLWIAAMARIIRIRTFVWILWCGICIDGWLIDHTKGRLSLEQIALQMITSDKKMITLLKEDRSKAHFLEWKDYINNKLEWKK